MDVKKRPPEQAAQRVAFVPRTTGIFVLLIIALASVAGAMRGELALSLIGAVFFVVWAYCLTMTLLLALIHRGRARRLVIHVTPREIAVGETARIVYSENGAFFRLPGILIRCRLLLRSKDGRRITHDFDPACGRSKAAAGEKSGGGQNTVLREQQAETFQAMERGAFFSAYDEFAVFDALGFFRFAWRIPQEADARLLVCPHPAETPPALPVYNGGIEHPGPARPRRGDNLIDHRPYIPGDDPRRINWKLFGHGGELFVREEEPEPPPRSNILILIDTHYDTTLYSAKAGRHGVDLLCEHALAAALDCAQSGIETLTGFSGGEDLDAAKQDAANANVNANGKSGAFTRENTPAGLAAVFAHPSAIPWPEKRTAAKQKNHELPEPPDNRGVLVFALPRAAAESSALDRFVNRYSHNGKNADSPAEIIFLYDGSGNSTAIDEAAETCAAFYNRKPGIRARRIKLHSE